MSRWNEKYHDKFKRHSLSGQLMDVRYLDAAWKKVRANRGSGGIDGETIESFEAKKESELAEVRRLLKERRYRPQPVRRVFIPKPDGRKRPLGIPTIRDRVVQQTMKDLLEPIFEEIFLEGSHGYRPGKGRASSHAKGPRLHWARLPLDCGCGHTRFLRPCELSNIDGPCTGESRRRKGSGLAEIIPEVRGDE